MRLRELHTVPIWQDKDGTRRPGFEPEDDHPPVVAWGNVAVIEGIEDEPVPLLLVFTEDDE
jgi:hypothetical protein